MPFLSPVLSWPYITIYTCCHALIFLIFIFCRVFKNSLPQLLRGNQTKHLFLNIFIQNLVSFLCWVAIVLSFERLTLPFRFCCKMKCSFLSSVNNIFTVYSRLQQMMWSSEGETLILKMHILSERHFSVLLYH